MDNQKEKSKGLNKIEHYYSITMVMETIQIRLTKKLVEKIDELVKEGFYPNRSEAVRDAVRRLIVEQELGELGEELEGGELGLKRNFPERIKEMREYCH